MSHHGFAEAISNRLVDQFTALRARRRDAIIHPLRA